MVKAIPFVGRQQELQDLRKFINNKKANLIVIKGRRRIGKSRLVEEFARGKRFYSFSGLPPTSETSAQAQREEFARQLSDQLDLPGLRGDDWGDLFTLLAKQTQDKKCIILLDEISWMGSKDPNFLGKLKIAWDLYFSKNPSLVLILCGSVSSWIEKNIISSTGFLGRISHKLTLNELSLKNCAVLLQERGFKGSAMEVFLILSVTGGVPWYLELIDNTLPAVEAIQRLCFRPNGILVDEFHYIFSDLFGRRGEICKKIVSLLAEGSTGYKEITKELGYPSGGPLSEYLDDLIMSGFIQRDYTWNLKLGRPSQLSHYRLRDNYLRFYLKYIAPVRDNIEKGQFVKLAFTSFSNWQGIMGLQFENLALNNRYTICNHLGINLQDIVYDNPFFQKKTSTQQGCQIDYLIQTKFNTLYVCEIKFSNKKIGQSIIAAVSQKINRLQIPKGFSIRPVLIHTGGVSETVLEKAFFSNIIDFRDLLAPSE